MLSSSLFWVKLALICLEPLDFGLVWAILVAFSQTDAPLYWQGISMICSTYRCVHTVPTSVLDLAIIISLPSKHTGFKNYLLPFLVTTTFPALFKCSYVALRCGSRSRYELVDFTNYTNNMYNLKQVNDCTNRSLKCLSSIVFCKPF